MDSIPQPFVDVVQQRTNTIDFGPLSFLLLFDNPDALRKSLEELRRQRNDLKEELDETRERVSELERQLYEGERAAVKEYIEENPGSDCTQITEHVARTVPQRVSNHLEELEAVDEIREEEERYYP